MWRGSASVLPDEGAGVRVAILEPDLVEVGDDRSERLTEGCLCVRDAVLGAVRSHQFLQGGKVRTRRPREDVMLDLVLEAST